MKVGITGHQDLGNPQQIFEIKKIIKKVISGMNISMGYTSLAVGADQLFAQELYEEGQPYYAIIPSKDYETTFKNKDSLKKYNFFIKNAHQIVTLPFEQPEERAFYEAGKYIAETSDCIIAIWDGKGAKGLGGTGDIVEYSLELNKRVIHINPVTFTINSL